MWSGRLSDSTFPRPISSRRTWTASLFSPGRHVGARELVKHLGETRLAARHSGEVLPRLLAVPAEERAARGLEAAPRAQEELRRVVEPAAGLERRRRRGEAAGAAKERRRLVVVLELAVEGGRLLDLARSRVGLRRRDAIPPSLVQGRRPLEAARFLPRVGRADEVSRFLEETRRAQRLPGPPPRVRGGDEVAAALGLARQELLGALLVAGPGGGESRLRQGPAPLERLDGLRRAAALHEQLAREQVTPARSGTPRPLLRAFPRSGRRPRPASRAPPSPAPSASPSARRRQASARDA